MRCIVYPRIKCPVAAGSSTRTEDKIMSKGLNQKKTTKKKPEKTLMEKRAAKAEKKKLKGR